MVLTSIATAILNVIGLKRLITSSDSQIDEFFKDRSKMKTLSTGGNITDLLNNVVIEPVVVPTNKATKSPIYEKIVDVNIDLFGVYYTEAFNSLNKIRGFSLEQTLNLLSSKRYSGTMDTVSSIIDSVQESESTIEFLPLTQGSPTLENEKKGGSVTTIVRKIGLRGKLKATDEANTELTIVIAGVVKEVTFKQILSLLSDEVVKGSLKYWYQEWRSGGTSLWNLIFGTEMIKEYHKSVFKDEKDFEQMVKDRVDKANRQLLTDGAVGFSKLYQMLIITEDEMYALERAIGLYFHVPKDVNKILEETSSLAITVLSDDSELASIYISGLRNPIVTSYKKLQKKKEDMQLADFARVLSTRSI